MERAVFAAASFWTAEAAFRRAPGVWQTCVGVGGGQGESSAHAQVAAGATDQAEAVLIDHDPGQVSCRDLLEMFWKIDDPGGRAAGPRPGVAPCRRVNGRPVPRVGRCLQPPRALSCVGASAAAGTG